LAAALLLAPAAIPALAAGGSITGTVTANGVGIAGVPVLIDNAFGGEVVARLMTDGAGNYSASVADGTYYVLFNPPETSGLAHQWYDRAISTADGTRVVVSGSPVTGIDGRLVAGHLISGVVSDAATGGPLPGVSVLAYVGTINGQWLCCYGAGAALADAAGRYSIRVQDGVYRLSFALQGYPTQWWRLVNATDTVAGHRAATDVPVQGADAAGIDARLGANVVPPCIAHQEAPTTTVYLPNITKTLGGPQGWVTPFIVQNVGGVPTTLEVSFYGFADGALVTCRRIWNLAPGTSYADVPNNDVDLPHDRQFSVVVRSYGSTVVAAVNEHQGQGLRAEALSYVGLSRGATKVLLPYLSKFYRSWLTTVVVQNLGTSAATVRADLQSYDGARAVSLARLIQPGRAQFIDPSAEPAIALNDELSGIISADQPIAVIVNAHNDAPSATALRGFSYNGIPLSATTTSYMPYVSKVDAGDSGPGDARVAIQNAGDTPATPSLTFQPLGGGSPVTISAPSPVAPGGVWLFDPQIYKVAGGYQLCRNAGAGRCIAPGEHSLTVGGGQFAVLNVQLTGTTAMGLIAAAPASKLYVPNVTRTLGGALGWTTPIIVQSAGATSATLRWYRFADGILIHTQPLAGLTTGASYKVDPRTLAALADDTQYAVVIEAVSPVTAIVTELNSLGGDGAMAYEAFAALP
jgi:hypothetical protein